MVKSRTMKTRLLFLGLFYFLTFSSTMAEEEYLSLNVKNISQHSSSDTSRYNDLLIKPFHLEIVPPSSGVQFYRDGILFLSLSKVEEKIPERHISFGSVRTYFSLVADTLPGQYMTFNLDGTDLFPTEATTFTSDYNTMYLSLIPAGLSSEKIFRAAYTQAGWKIDSDPLEICSGRNIYSHPSLSVDGTFMVFSSDMPGSTGGLDLFITRKEKNGWGEPENLGKVINSPGNELFAALDSRNNLFFSTDGRPGQGGYDIYLCRFNGSGWEKPHNLAETVNTKDDELAITVNRVDDKTAFFTRRARSGRYRTQMFIMKISPGPDANSSLTLFDCFQGNENSKFTVSKEVKTEGETKFFNLSVNQENIAKNTTNSHDSVSKKPGPQFPEIKKEVVASVKKPGTDSTAEAKKEETSEVNKSQSLPSKENQKDEVVYRVQILANTKPAGSQNITVSGKNYKSFEYLYKGGYRTTIGEFSTLAEATRLQSLCRQNGYSQAFVVAFKNNVRSTDPELFK